MQYFLWIPAVLLYYGFHAWMSRQNNLYGGKWIWILLVYHGIGGTLWIAVSRYSKALLFDGALYDVLIFLTYLYVMMWLGVADEFTSLQRMGIAMVGGGFILMRCGTS